MNCWDLPVRLRVTAGPCSWSWRKSEKQDFHAMVLPGTLIEHLMKSGHKRERSGMAFNIWC